MGSSLLKSTARMATIQGVAPLQGDKGEREQERESKPPTTPILNLFSFTPPILDIGRARKCLKRKVGLLAFSSITIEEEKLESLL